MGIDQESKRIRWILVAVAVPTLLGMGRCSPVHGVSQPNIL